MISRIKWNYVIAIALVAVLVYLYAIPYFRHIALHYKTKALYSSLEHSHLPWQVVGQSENGHNIYLLDIGRGETTTIIFGAFHGDEQTGFHLVCQLAESLYTHPDWIHERALLVPVVNPDGLMARTRTNANGVDINRNFPTGNWSPVYTKKRYFPGINPGSEAETQIVMGLLEKYHPDKIITIHEALEMNNYDGPARELAELLASYNHYPVTTDVGYATPGSFGNYAGKERKIPTVTLELPDTDIETAWQQNWQGLIDAINFKMNRNETAPVSADSSAAQKY